MNPRVSAPPTPCPGQSWAAWRRQQDRQAGHVKPHVPVPSHYAQGSPGQQGGDSRTDRLDNSEYSEDNSPPKNKNGMDKVA